MNIQPFLKMSGELIGMKQPVGKQTEAITDWRDYQELS